MMLPSRSGSKPLRSQSRHIFPLLASLSVAGCSQFPAPSSIPLPATTKVLDGMPRVNNGRDIPCRTQVEIAAQNSYVDTIQSKTEKVYTAPCKMVEPVKIAGR